MMKVNEGIGCNFVVDQRNGTRYRSVAFVVIIPRKRIKSSEGHFKKKLELLYLYLLIVFRYHPIIFLHQLSVLDKAGSDASRLTT